MAILITRNILHGQTSLDTFTPTGRHDRLVRIPGLATGTGALTETTDVAPLLPSERLYDLGWSSNLRQLASQQLLSSKNVHQKYVLIPNIVYSSLLTIPQRRICLVKIESVCLEPYQGREHTACATHRPRRIAQSEHRLFSRCPGMNFYYVAVP